MGIRVDAGAIERGLAAFVRIYPRETATVTVGLEHAMICPDRVLPPAAGWRVRESGQFGVEFVVATHRRPNAGIGWVIPLAQVIASGALAIDAAARLHAHVRGDKVHR